MRIVVRTVWYASGGSPIASTTSATLDSPRSHRTCMSRDSASVRVGDFLRGMHPRYHRRLPLSTKVLRRTFFAPVLPYVKSRRPLVATAVFEPSFPAKADYFRETTE